MNIQTEWHSANTELIIIIKNKQINVFICFCIDSVILINACFYSCVVLQNE